MTRKKVLLFYMVTICLLCVPGIVQAQSEVLAYEEIRADMYGTMLAYGDGENYVMILESLPSLGAITDEIRSRFGVDIGSEIDSAVKNRNKKTVLSALYKLIYYDIKNSFYTIQREDGQSQGAVRSLLKSAFASYSRLSPEVKRIDAEADQRIKKLFEWAIYIVPSESAPSFTKMKGDGIDKKSMGKLKKLMGLVEEECSKVFPDFEASGSSIGQWFQFFMDRQVQCCRIWCSTDGRDGLEITTSFS